MVGERTSGRRDETRSIGGDIAAVYLEIFEVAYKKVEMSANVLCSVHLCTYCYARRWTDLGASTTGV